MPREFLFWGLMFLWLILGLWFEYIPNQPYPFKRGLYNVLVFVLLAIVGWQIFEAYRGTRTSSTRLTYSWESQ